MSLLLVPSSTAAPAFHVRYQAGQAELLDGTTVDCGLPVDRKWIQKFNRIQWVAYTPPNPDPDGGFHQPTAEAIYQDLLTLRKAGFTGLITYGSAGIMGKQFLDIALSLDYKGIVMGIWDPANQGELNNATNASGLPIVLGYSIGNEGLSESRARYSLLELCSAISGLRRNTGKPVTTSEDIETYYRKPELLSVGDWIFAISHPYWHFTKFPLDAIRWEEEQYSELLKRTDRFVFFKEVGLPTAGAYGLSEKNQDLYYRGLAKTEVRFAYFEGFDQPSKTYASVEPHWGIFHSDLTPKLLAWNLMEYRVFTSDNLSDNLVLDCPQKNSGNCSTRADLRMLLVGFDLRERQYISILSFNTAGLPDNAVITSAKLRVKTAGVVGVSPLNRHQGLEIGVCRSLAGPFTTKTTDPQTRLDCTGPAETFDKSPNDGWYTVDLDPLFFEFINLERTSQFRLRINGMADPDSSRAYIKFYGSDAIDTNHPVLIIRYSIP